MLFFILRKFMLILVIVLFSLRVFDRFLYFLWLILVEEMFNCWMCEFLVKEIVRSCVFLLLMELSLRFNIVRYVLVWIVWDRWLMLCLFNWVFLIFSLRI